MKNPTLAHPKKSLLWDIKHKYVLYLMLIPGLLFYLIYRYLPMCGIIIAFKDYNIFSGIFDSKWVGLYHFEKLFQSSAFFRALQNSLIISSLKLIINFPLPIVLAIFLNEIRNERFKKTVQTITYFPHFLSWVVVAGLLNNLLSPTDGLINALIKASGGKAINFLVNKAWFRPILIVSDLWVSLGWNSILYIAAINSIDPTLYEAATVDGAGRWRRMWHITLPGIRPTIVMLLILRIGSIMSNGFEQVYLLYSPLVYAVGDVLETYVYRIGMVDARYDFSTAVGLFQSVVNFTLILTANWLAHRTGEGGIF